MHDDLRMELPLLKQEALGLKAESGAAEELFVLLWVELLLGGWVGLGGLITAENAVIFRQPAAGFLKTDFQEFHDKVDGIARRSADEAAVGVAPRMEGEAGVGILVERTQASVAFHFQSEPFSHSLDGE